MFGLATATSLVDPKTKKVINRSIYIIIEFRCIKRRRDARGKRVQYSTVVRGASVITERSNRRQSQNDWPRVVRQELYHVIWIPVGTFLFWVLIIVLTYAVLAVLIYIDSIGLRSIGSTDLRSMGYAELTVLVCAVLGIRSIDSIDLRSMDLRSISLCSISLRSIGLRSIENLSECRVYRILQ